MRVKRDIWRNDSVAVVKKFSKFSMSSKHVVKSRKQYFKNLKIQDHLLTKQDEEYGYAEIQKQSKRMDIHVCTYGRETKRPEIEMFRYIFPEPYQKSDFYKELVRKKPMRSVTRILNDGFSYKSEATILELKASATLYHSDFDHFINHFGILFAPNNSLGQEEKVGGTDIHRQNDRTWYQRDDDLPFPFNCHCDCEAFTSSEKELFSVENSPSVDVIDTLLQSIKHVSFVVGDKSIVELNAAQLKMMDVFTRTYHGRSLFWKCGHGLIYMKMSDGVCRDKFPFLSVHFLQYNTLKVFATLKPQPQQSAAGHPDYKFNGFYTNCSFLTGGYPLGNSERYIAKPYFSLFNKIACIRRTIANNSSTTWINIADEMCNTISMNGLTHSYIGMFIYFSDFEDLLLRVNVNMYTSHPWYSATLYACDIKNHIDKNTGKTFYYIPFSNIDPCTILRRNPSISKKKGDEDFSLNIMDRDFPYIELTHKNKKKGIQDDTKVEISIVHTRSMMYFQGMLLV